MHIRPANYKSLTAGQDRNHTSSKPELRQENPTSLDLQRSCYTTRKQHQIEDQLLPAPCRQEQARTAHQRHRRSRGSTTFPDRALATKLTPGP
jgi:hypothetical protein